MKWKRLGTIAALSVLLLAAPVSASDVGRLAKQVLPKGFTYTDIPGDRQLETAKGTISYHTGQLSVLLPKSQRFSSGYIVTAEFPVDNPADIAPYLDLNLKPDAWRGLIKINRMITDPMSELRLYAGDAMKKLAASVIGPLAETDLKLNIYGVEPLRRFDSNTPYLYTVGYRIIANSGTIILPLYSRMYIYPEKDMLRVLMLVTPDEGKGPLVYALDDLAKAAIKEAAGPFSVNMTAEESLSREEELSVILGRYEMEKKRRQAAEV